LRRADSLLTEAGERAGERWSMNQPSTTGSPTICAAQILGSFSEGGAQRLAYNLAVGIGQRGARSFAIALRDSGHFAEAPPPEVSLRALGAGRGGFIQGWKGIQALRRLIVQENIQVLHVHGTRSLPLVVLATFGLRRRVRVAFTWQDSENVLDRGGWQKQVLTWAIRRCDHVSGSSRDVVRRLERRTGLTDVGVFHGGVPATAFVPRRPGSPVSILWIGRMVPPKDPQALIRAAAHLREKGHPCEVHLVGSPMGHTESYFERTRALIADLQLSDSMFAPGFVPDDDLPPLFAGAHIGVQTSHTEGLSIALMEQMMAGLAIVATDVGDTSCAIQNEVNGLLIPPRDDAALAAALRRLITDPELRRRLGEAARETAIRQFSLDAMADRALAEYIRIIGPDR